MHKIRVAIGRGGTSPSQTPEPDSPLIFMNDNCFYLYLCLLFVRVFAEGNSRGPDKGEDF